MLPIGELIKSVIECGLLLLLYVTNMRDSQEFRSITSNQQAVISISRIRRVKFHNFSSRAIDRETEGDWRGARLQPITFTDDKINTQSTIVLIEHFFLWHVASPDREIAPKRCARALIHSRRHYSHIISKYYPV